MSMRIDCFKAYDIRGQIPNQLNPDVAYRIANRDSVGKLGAGQSNVAPQYNFLCIQELSRGIADSVSDLFVQLIRDLPAYVVGLKTVDFQSHVLVPLRP